MSTQQAQKRSLLWFIICFTLVSLMVAGYVMAEYRINPPTSPPIAKEIKTFSGVPVSNKPPIDPPEAITNSQALSNSANAEPLTNNRQIKPAGEAQGVINIFIDASPPAQVPKKDIQTGTTTIPMRAIDSE